MKITDAQVHIWAASTPERPWPKRAAPHRPVPFTAEDLIREMNEAGIDRAVVIPPSFEGDRNDLALAAAAANPGRIGIMGRLDPNADDAREQVEHWREQPGMLGMRFTFSQPSAQELLASGSLEWVWEAAEKNGIPLMVNASHSQIALLERLATQFPMLRLTVDHLGLISGQKDEEAFSRLDQLLELAKYDNVAVKASALPGYSTDTYPYSSLHPYIRRVYDAFGAQRMFWGTDITRMPISYRQMVTLFTEEIPWLTDEDKEWIMGRGICEWLGWPE
ncbi:amidohydrolase family protein [Streptomyces sp. NPDC005549]|uniref:amidohydrolase family protein n=1 Tax=Streptomyces sp. NPDC005549 TaxID=3154888 RepID=UPI0033B8FB71